MSYMQFFNVKEEAPVTPPKKDAIDWNASLADTPNTFFKKLDEILLPAKPVNPPPSFKTWMRGEEVREQQPVVPAEPQFQDRDWQIQNSGDYSLEDQAAHPVKLEDIVYDSINVRGIPEFESKPHAPACSPTKAAAATRRSARIQGGAVHKKRRAWKDSSRSTATETHALFWPSEHEEANTKLTIQQKHFAFTKTIGKIIVEGGLSNEPKEYTIYKPLDPWLGFGYTPRGDLHQHIIFTPEILRKFIYNHPMGNRLILRIERHPWGSATRKFNGAHPCCRSQECAAGGDNGIIKTGELRVSFDEVTNRIDPNDEAKNDPYFSACWMHLDCFEKMVNVPELVRAGVLVFDTRKTLPSQDPNVRLDNKMMPKRGCEMEFNMFKFKCETNREWVPQETETLNVILWLRSAKGVRTTRRRPDCVSSEDVSNIKGLMNKNGWGGHRAARLSVPKMKEAIAQGLEFEAARHGKISKKLFVKKKDRLRLEGVAPVPPKRKYTRRSKPQQEQPVAPSNPEPVPGTRFAPFLISSPGLDPEFTDISVPRYGNPHNGNLEVSQHQMEGIQYDQHQTEDSQYPERYHSQEYYPEPSPENDCLFQYGHDRELQRASPTFQLSSPQYIPDCLIDPELFMNPGIPVTSATEGRALQVLFPMDPNLPGIPSTPDFMKQFTESDKENFSPISLNSLF